MKIKIYFFGKKNEITKLEQEYLKRINFKIKAEFVPLPQAGIKEAQKAKEVEGDFLINKISSTDFLIAFDEHGQEFNSIEFSKKLIKQIETFGDINFVIGGAHGLSDKILKRANIKISFSKMVWTRNLFRLMTTEQIYRAIDLANNGNFHKF
jgi:23S rRNA (pseudouridine1915-N3)-methyltransferase